MTSLDVRTIRQRVYDALKEQILTGIIRPGQLVSLRKLADHFGVSQMPVREALWQLESEQVICIEANRRMYVNTLSPEEMEECLRVRLLVESHAAERAARLRPDEAVSEVEMIFQTMVDSIADPSIYIVKNKELHFTIYSCAESPILLHLIERLWMRVGPYFFIHADDNPQLRDTQELHAEMVRGFREKNPETLVQALREDLRSTAAFLLPKLSQLETTGMGGTRKIASTDPTKQ